MKQLSFLCLRLMKDIGEIGMILGIDPGATGAIAFLWPDDFYMIDDLPIVDGIVNSSGLLTLLKKTRFPYIPQTVTFHHAFVERAQSMPKQGIASTFKYGVGYGAILGVLAALQIPYTLVSPQKWKKVFGLIGKDKEASRALAIQWYPKAELHLKKHHGRSEALLIARWGMAHGTT